MTHTVPCYVILLHHTYMILYNIIKVAIRNMVPYPRSIYSSFERALILACL